MKRATFLVVLIFFTFHIANAQSRLGFRASGQITSMSTSEAASRFGFSAGAMFSSQLTDNLYLQPSLVVSLDGSKAADKYKPDYSGYTYSVEAPIALSLRGGDEDLSVGFDFGGFARYAFAGSYWTDSPEGRIKPDIFDHHKRFNFGPMIGFSVMVGNAYLGSSFQYGVIKQWSGKRGCDYSYGVNIGYLFELY